MRHVLLKKNAGIHMGICLSDLFIFALIIASLLFLLLALLGVVEVVRSVPPLYLVSRVTSVALCGDEKETKGKFPFEPKENISRIKINIVLGGVYLSRSFFELIRNVLLFQKFPFFFFFLNNTT